MTQKSIIKPWQSTGKKRPRVDIDAVEMEILKQLKDTCMSDQDDEDMTFGQSIALTLKKMEPQQKSFAKIKIQEVLYAIQFPPPPPTYSNSSISRDYYHGRYDYGQSFPTLSDNNE